MSQAAIELSAIELCIGMVKLKEDQIKPKDDSLNLAEKAHSELAQLRYRVAMLDILEGDDGLIASNRLMDACERGDIPQQLMPDIQEARNEIVQLRATVADARELLTTLDWNDWDKRVDDWLAANASQEGG